MQVVALVATGIIQAGQQKRAGEIQEAQSVIDANAEGDSAREREIGRKKGLKRALSSQLAQSGATGVAFDEGSPLAIAQLDIAEAERDLALDTATSKQRQRALKRQGKNARITGAAQSTVTLLDTAVQAGEEVSGMLE